MRHRPHIGRLGALLLLIPLLGVSGCRERPYDTSMYYLPDVDELTGATNLIEHPYILEELGLKLDKLSYLRGGEFVLIEGRLTGDVQAYEGCELYVHAYQQADDERFLNLGGKLVLEDGALVLSRRDSVPPNTAVAELRFGLGCQKQRKFSIAIRDLIIE